MDDKKVFVVGDIHGCLDMLKRLMDTIPLAAPRGNKLTCLELPEMRFHSVSE